MIQKCRLSEMKRKPSLGASIAPSGSEQKRLRGNWEIFPVTCRRSP